MHFTLVPVYNFTTAYPRSIQFSNRLFMRAQSSKLGRAVDFTAPVFESTSVDHFFTDAAHFKPALQSTVHSPILCIELARSVVASSQP